VNRGRLNLINIGNGAVKNINDFLEKKKTKYYLIGVGKRTFDLISKDG